MAYLWILALILPIFAIDPFPDEKWESGFIQLDTAKRALHYWYFPCRNQNLDRIPLIIWLDGGPGYSSAFGVYEHGGPYIINNKTLLLEKNPYTWTNFADILFVDQPAGTLFSYTFDPNGFCTSETCVTQDFYTFLTKFYDKYPIYKTRDLYLCGISYGGHYIPAIADYLLIKNNPEFKLKGIATFNGLTDYYEQLFASPKFLYENKLINSFLYLAFQGIVLACQISRYMNPNVFSEFCFNSHTGMYMLANIPNDPYDIQEIFGPEPNEEFLKKYLNLPDIQAALGVNQKFVPTNDTVFVKLIGDFPLKLTPAIANVLHKNIPVFLIYGDKDYICNWMGGELMANSIQWDGQKEFLNKEYTNWDVNGVIKGKYKEYKKLRFIVAHGCGHSLFAKQRVFGSEILKTLINS